ncbi:MAG: putative ABC transporter permease [Clostridiales bacterium]|nr:putative ABC transporter permease [Clostridiales bacterium]
MKNNFIKCGITGWCLEVLFTGIHSMIHKDFRLMGKTSILMFPIYGLAAFLRPIYRLTKHRSVFFRGSIYTCCIFLTEYISGIFLKKKGICPWDYSSSPLNVRGVIRLDYAPFWFGTGLLFERILK